MRPTSADHRPWRAALAILVIAAITLSACEDRSSSPSLRFTALGTRIEITITRPGEADGQAAARAAKAEIEAIDQAWSPEGDGELAALNERIAAGEGMTVSPELISVLERARRVERLSEGRFSPAIGGLIDLWGFSDTNDPLEGPPPEAEIKRWLKQEPQLEDLHWSERYVESENNAVQLNLGGIGKGFAGEQAIEALRAHGVHAAIVSLGGDLVTLGAPADRAWRMGVRDPRERDVLASVEAEADEHIFTSGDYERKFIHEDQRYHHILDPRTGYPAMGSQSVTVVHSDPVLADAAATALFIAGPEAWQEMAEALGTEHVLLIDRDGTAHMTASMARRVSFEQEMAKAHIED